MRGNTLYACLIWKNMVVPDKPVARPVNLVQASQSRLGEMNRELASGILRERSPRWLARRFERASISPKREGSRLSEISHVLLLPFSSPRLGEGGSPERDPSA